MHPDPAILRLSDDAMLRSPHARFPGGPPAQRACSHPRSRLRRLHRCASSTDGAARRTMHMHERKTVQRKLRQERSRTTFCVARTMPGTPRGGPRGERIPRARITSPARLLRNPRALAAATLLALAPSRCNLACQRSASARWLRSWSVQRRYSGLNSGLGLLMRYARTNSCAGEKLHVSGSVAHGP